jgi:predicted MPP superfamily phosphohydrolase
MRRPLRRLRRGLLVFVVGAHAPLVMAIDALLAHLAGGAPPWLAIAIAPLMSLNLPLMLRRARWDRPITRWRRLLIDEPTYVHVLALVATPVTTLLATLLALVAGQIAPASLLTRAGLGRVCLLGYVLALAVALWGVVVRRRWVRVTRIEVVLPRLDPAFDGYRVAQLSDLHIGSSCPKERAAGWVRRVNALAVDAVVLTGDYVTTGVRFHHDIASTLAPLRATDGVFAIMGNHDYFGDGEPLLGLLRAAGIRVLQNEHAVVERGAARLVIAGVDDRYTERTDVERALRGVDAQLPLVALAHDPRAFPELAARGAGLTLSGHTHWGQLALPFAAARFNLARLLARFSAGSYHQGEALLYVSSGLGTTGVPVRLGAAPEIVVFRLRAPNAPHQQSAG